MYNYPEYIEKDQAKVIEFMHNHPFITLIGCDLEKRIEATQIPVLVEEREGRIILHGHVARKTDHHKAFEDNPDVLALFTSPHTYVSGTWYTGNPRQASTWNYISIQARGTIQFKNEEALIGLLKKLSLHFEKGNVHASTIYDNLPVEYTGKLVKAIIAFEIEVSEIENVFKLSQNRDQMSYENIITELENQDDSGRYIAQRMRENGSQVFKEK
jgi:transcriptional regulator